MKYPIVIVEWEDATNVAEWTDIETAKKWEGFEFDYNCTSVGYMIYNGEDCVILAARATGEFRNVGLVERIPGGMVKTIRIIKR